MAVIQNGDERDGALKELERLWSFLHEVERRSPEHSSTKASIHKMMARIHEELMEYEAGRELVAARTNGKVNNEQRGETAVETASFSE
jgi:phosphoribosyl-ATP pyrophosphohydrolase